MQTLTNEAIEQATAVKGKKAIVALANAHKIDAKGTKADITERLQQAVKAADDGLDIPPFLQRSKDEAPKVEAQEEEAPQEAQDAPQEDEPEAEAQPAEEAETATTTDEEPFKVLPLETMIAGETVQVFQIELGDDKYAGPFDTEAQAIAFRDKHFASKTKTGRKRNIAKTPADPGKMTDKYRNKTITLKDMPGDGDHLTAQAEGCMEALREVLMAKGDEDNPAVSCTQGELVDYLIADADDGRAFINTTQSPKRIWDFYRKSLIEKGYITVL